MIVDSLAIIAILRDEDDAGLYRRAIGEARRASISAANWLEAAIVAEARDPAAPARFDAVVAAARLQVVDVTPELAQAAREAWRRFGKGRHPAALNFGDCFAYALARSRGEPLLFKGEDFARTDVTPALPHA